MKRNVVILLIISLICIVLGILLLLHSFVWKPQNPPLAERQLTFNGHAVTAEIADTVLARMRGLSNRPTLAESHGMLFVYGSPGSYGFWMKDMHFPLDFVWLNGDTVVGVTANVPTQPRIRFTKLKVYYPPAPSDRMLELNAGEAAKLEIVAGTKVQE